MKLNNFVICDDIRTEISKKYSLIGLYDDAIIFNTTPDKKNTWPKSMRISFLINLQIDEGEIGNYSSFKFVTFYNKKRIEIGSGTIENKTANKIILPVVIPMFQFIESGEMSFCFEFSDRDGKLINTFPFEKTIKISENTDFTKSN